MNNSDEKPIFGDLTMSDLESIERTIAYMQKTSRKQYKDASTKLAAATQGGATAPITTQKEFDFAVWKEENLRKAEQQVKKLLKGAKAIMKMQEPYDRLAGELEATLQNVGLKAR